MGRDMKTANRRAARAPRPATPGVERLEGRALMAFASRHALLLSVDGLHAADVADPALAADLRNIRAVQAGGYTYTNATTTSPSDSFPGTLAYLTGARPGTTGVYYDDSYDRKLFAPGSSPSASAPGTEVVFDESIDKNPTLLSGGGNFDASSIDPTKLPLDRFGHVVYPSAFLKVNTIFDVASRAGLHTAFSDKHPAYDLANGRTGNSIQDLYTPEIAADAALLDPTTNRTIDAAALLASNPAADLGRYTLVDASTDPVAVDPATKLSADPNLTPITHNVLLTEKYDDLKVAAIRNEIDGLNSRGAVQAAIPNLFGMNFQAVSVAEKFIGGGIDLTTGGPQPSAILRAALAHTDASIGSIVAELKGRGLYGSTMVVITAKHGQSPRAGVAGLINGGTIPGVLNAAGVAPAQVTQDDVSLIWLKDQTRTAAAVRALRTFRDSGAIEVSSKGVKSTVPAAQVIQSILAGRDLQRVVRGNALQDSRTPDIVVTLKPGYVIVGNPKKFDYKRAEHGGFSADDTRVPLIVGGGVARSLAGRSSAANVETRQIAVTVLNYLGLDARKLEGAAREHTRALPGPARRDR